MLEGLRTHLILSWLAALVAGTVGMVIAGLTNSQGLQLDEYMWRLFSNFTGTTLPMLGMMVGSYFSSDLKTVLVSAGQKIVALALSYTYLVAVLGTLGWVIFISPAHMAGNPFSILTMFSSIIAAVVAYVFGTAAKRRPSAKRQVQAKEET